MGKYIKRETSVPLDTFIKTIAQPIMQKVAAKQLKKNLGLVVSALCGGIKFFPIQTEYTGNTNPLQTLSSHLSHYKCQPNHLEPNYSNIEDLEILVYPNLNEQNNIPHFVIDRFVSLCDKYHVDHSIFTQRGGKIKLTKNLLKVAAYFASDKGLEPEKCIWGTIKPLSHIHIDLLEEEDIAQIIKNRVPGRKKGRPRIIIE